MTAHVTLHTEFSVGPIDRRIFGGFLEHLGRAVYGGIYDPQSPRSDEQGLRRDVLEALDGLQMPIIRYPGGNYVSAYDWKHTVGPRASRPRRPDYAWQSIETNQFGIGEFMGFCDALKSAPFLAVNLGTQGAAEAANLVEYCNLPAGTQWAELRAEHGRKAPYAVPLWGLGNEVDGPWQAGHVPANVYASRAFQASFLMKQLDPGIQTVAAGSSGRGMATYLEWDREVLETCWDTVDFISAHRYSENPNQDAAWFLAEGVEIDRVLADYAGVIDYVRGLKRSDKRVYLAFDEWNVWYRARGPAHSRGGWREAPPLLEETYNLEDALVCAQYLNAFLRRADLVKIGCLAQIVNVIAPIMTRSDALLLQTTYHAFQMFSQAARGTSLTPVVQAPEYRAGARGSVPALDVAATFDAETERASVFLVNRDAQRELEVEVRLQDRRAGAANVTLLGGGDVQRHNDWSAPSRVCPRAGRALDHEGALRVTVPAPGLARLTFEAGPR